MGISITSVFIVILGLTISTFIAPISLVGIWLINLIGNIIVTIGSVTYYLTGRWKKNKVALNVGNVLAPPELES